MASKQTNAPAVGLDTEEKVTRQAHPALPKGLPRDSIFAFEIHVDTSCQLDESGMPIYNKHGWLIFPASFFLATLFCVLFIVGVPLGDPSLGLAENWLYVFVYIGVFQFLISGVLYVVFRRSFVYFSNGEYERVRYLSTGAIVVRSVVSSVLGCSMLCIVSAWTGTFPVRGGFSFFVAGTTLVASVEPAVYAVLRGCSSRDVGRSLALSSRFLILYLCYVVGYTLAIVFVDFYGTFSPHWQTAFTACLSIWKAILPVVVPYLASRWLGRSAVSPVFLALMSTSCHLFWTLVATLCFSSMSMEAFVIYVIADVVAASCMGAKGSQLFWDKRKQAEGFFKRKLAFSSYPGMGEKSPKEESAEQQEIWHDRSYFTATYVMNTIGEILIPFHVLTILWFARETDYWKSVPNYFQSLQYCLIMVVSDVLHLILMTAIYHFSTTERRNIFLPISYVLSKHPYVPWLICMGTLLPALGLLPAHCGIAINF